MTRTHSYVVHAVVTITPTTAEDASVAAVKAGTLAALRAGLQAEVQSLEMYEVALTETPATPAPAQPATRRAPPKPRVSSQDELVDQYEHAGMDVQIRQEANSGHKPKYFAVVFNPQAKHSSGSLIEAKYPASFNQTVEVANLRAERRAQLWARRQGQTPPASPLPRQNLDRQETG